MQLFGFLKTMIIAYLIIGSARGGDVLGSTGFKDRFYPLKGYSGSRVLETNYTTYNYSVINWTNHVTFDLQGNQWIVDKALHTLVLINASDNSLPFPAYGEVIAGTRGRAGFLDGGNSIALLNSPTGVAAFDQLVFISDTLNHCIRKVDLVTQTTTTYAGVPGKAGFLDGDGSAARFSKPSAIGVDPITGMVFVLDNETKIRKLTVITSGLRTYVNVVTLVQGACRAQRAYSISNLIIREVTCQTDWEAGLIPAENITTWRWGKFCAGNTLTCQEIK